MKHSTAVAPWVNVLSHMHSWDVAGSTQVGTTARTHLVCVGLLLYLGNERSVANIFIFFQLGIRLSNRDDEMLLLGCHCMFCWPDTSDLMPFEGCTMVEFDT